MEWFKTARLPDQPVVWKRVFQPSHTLWGCGGEAVFQEKADALEVLFLNNPGFLRGGLQVVNEYMEWCDEHRKGDYKLTNANKVKLYLEHRTNRAQERWHQDKNMGTVKNNTPEECAVNSFRSAICHLDALAAWQGFGGRLLEQETIKVMRDRLMRAQNKARAQPRDYAASSRFLTKRLTQEDMEAITECWWDGRAAQQIANTPYGIERAQMRGLLFHCLQKSVGRRGADLRNIRNAMLFVHELPGTKPVRTCHVIGASLRHVKECSDNVEHLVGWVRCKDRLACPLGALACYFVWLIDIACVPLMEEIRRDLYRSQTETEMPWWKRMLFVTESVSDVNETPMAYSTHYRAIQAGYNTNGIAGMTAATHAYRSTLACDTLESGASFLDVGVYQGWYHDTAADTYLRGCFKSSMLLKACGWEDGRDSFECWWEGQETDIPGSLKARVFPGLDALLNEATERYKETRRDRSAVEFLKVLRLLRRIYIEDAVLKKNMYPSFPCYAKHVLFRESDWPQYCDQEQRRTCQREQDSRRDPQQEYICEVVKSSVEHAMKSVLADVLKDVKLNESSSNKRSSRPARQKPLPPPSNQPIELPCNPNDIPDIPEPSCLYTCYQTWQQQRAYFYATPQPPWKARFGERAAAMKLRYSRMRPFVMYLDRCGAEARKVIDALEAFRKERKVSAGVFIKQCFYHLEHPLKDTCKNPPPIKPAELKDVMERCGLLIY